MAELSDMGLFGLAVMGQNFALNVAEHGFKISVANRSPAKVDATVKRAKAELPDKAKDNVVGFHGATEEEKKKFVASLKKPRRIMFLVKAGAPVDSLIKDFTPLLEKGDILIDGGNEWFHNSERRSKEVEKHGIMYIAMGVSGGEIGARTGPSLMPGSNDPEAYKAMQPILEAVSATSFMGNTVTFFKGRGAGNYVKMVHNGIEYGDMQLIAEIYDLMKASGKTNDEMAAIFTRWNEESALDSYLVEITSDILAKKDVDVYKWSDGTELPGNENKYVVDMILDKTGNKGTGKMTVKESADEAVAAPTIAEALYARFVAADYDDRQEIAKKLKTKAVDFPKIKPEAFEEDLKNALYCSKVMSYAQGLNLIRQAAKDYDWEVDLGETARIWTAGCIIRAKLLGDVKKAFEKDPNLVNLMISDHFAKEVLARVDSWRRIVTLAVAVGVPVPALSASLAYFDSYRRARLPANLVQAQRDFFGSHTFERIDKPRGEAYHDKWTPEHA